MLRRLWCLLTLGHDPDFSTPREVPSEILFRFPCRKCGELLPVSIWSKAPAADEMYALALANREPGRIGIWDEVTTRSDPV